MRPMLLGLLLCATRAAAVDNGADDGAGGAQGATPPPAAQPAPAASDAPATPESPAVPAPDPVAETPSPAPPPAAPAAPAPASPPAPTAAAVDGTPTVAETAPTRRIGDPVPYTRREPMTNPLGFQLGVRYGLVGTGPTRFVDDIRFGVTDWLELRTALLPYPSTLMARVALGKQQSSTGVLLLDGGLAHFDAGVRLVPDTGEAKAGVRFHLEGGAAYARTLGDRVSLYAQAHYRYRLSFLPDDGGHALAVDAHAFYDLTDALAVSAGLGVATALPFPEGSKGRWRTTVRELGVAFVETDQPGMSHLLARDEGGSWSLTVPITMTYGRVENFDVDLFCTPRIFPELGILFGAGVRLRLDPFADWIKG